MMPIILAALLLAVLTTAPAPTGALQSTVPICASRPSLPRILYPHRHQWNGTAVPKTIPYNLTDYFTRCDAVPVESMVIDETFKGHGSHYKFDRASIDERVATFKRTAGNARATTKERHAMEALLSLGPLANLTVGVMGSQDPWLEAAALAQGAKHVTTIEYNNLTYTHPRITTATPSQYREMIASNHSQHSFDLILAVACVDHDGLGRYNDPIAPDGDLLTVDEWKTWLDTSNSNATIILTAPIGPDLVIWNLGRRYGRIRLPLLLDGFAVRARFGYDDKVLDAPANFRQRIEPAFVLTVKPATSTHDEL